MFRKRSKYKKSRETNEKLKEDRCSKLKKLENRRKSVYIVLYSIKKENVVENFESKWEKTKKKLWRFGVNPIKFLLLKSRN